jgi:hypothetical protein
MNLIDIQISLIYIHYKINKLVIKINRIENLKVLLEEIVILMIVIRKKVDNRNIKEFKKRIRIIRYKI